MQHSKNRLIYDSKNKKHKNARLFANNTPKHILKK